jgi:hypothetical protein
MVNHQATPLLAAVRLVVTLLNQYYDEILQCEEPARSKIQVYTDSLSMIKKLKAYGENLHYIRH